MSTPHISILLVSFGRLRAPVFLGLLPRKEGAARPPRRPTLTNTVVFLKE